MRHTGKKRPVHGRYGYEQQSTAMEKIKTKTGERTERRIEEEDQSNAHIGETAWRTPPNLESPTVTINNTSPVL